MALEGQQIITDQPKTAKDLLYYAVRSAIDVERADALQLHGDAATVNANGVAITPSESGGRLGAAIDTVRSFGPLQLGGLALAGVGIWALATGKFR